MSKIYVVTLYAFLMVWIPDFALAQRPGGSSQPTPVIAAKVIETRFAGKIEALGTLYANESVELTATVTELVTKINFDDNQRVKKDDILVEMDAAEEMAELQEQKSILAEADRQVNRLEPLVKKGAASAAVLDEQRREKLTAQSRIDAMQSRIDQRVIKAPYDGVLGLRNISTGALVQPGTIITTIDDTKTMKLDFAVPEIFLPALTIGLATTASSEAYPDQIFEGQISAIDSRIDPITRSIQVRALINNDKGLLKPGLLMKVSMAKNPRQAIVIPEEALITQGSQNFVLKIIDRDDKTIVERQQVTIGSRQFGIAEILTGLSDGDTVVTHGTLRARPGGEVTITALESGDETLKQLLTSGEPSKNSTDNESE